MASSTSSQNTQQNYSNANVTNPDDKNTVTSVTESPGEFLSNADARNRSSVAAAAEREWLARVSEPPKNGEASYSNGRSNKIRLVSTAVARSGNGQTNTGLEQVEFNLSPEISESKQVIYAEIGDIRQAASILIYGGSPSRKWSVNAKFLSRTAKEADLTWKSVQLMRSWANPDTNYKYGIDSGTPHVLRLYGYGRTWQGIPVVLSSVNVDYPSDIDYIPTEYGTNVPVIQSVSFQLTEARTPDDLLKKFDLEKFKLGVLPEW
jgi:hypothetical protein